MRGYKQIPEYNNKSLHVGLKEKFGIDDYYAGTLIVDAKAIIKSRKELLKIEIDELDQRINHKKEKIEDLKKELGKKKKMLKSCIVISSAIKDKNTNKKKLKLKTYKGCNERQLSYGYAVDYKKYSNIYYNLYDFEHQYLRPRIKEIKNRISLITHSVNIMNDKLERLKKQPKGITFGTKKLFRSQYSIYKDKHTEWYEKWYKARNNQFKIIGRNNGKYGNFVFKYDCLCNHLTLNNEYKIKNVTFTYGKELLINILTNKNLKIPLTWLVEDHEEYYIFKVSFEEPVGDRNYYKGNGVISYDKNYDHIAWTELDKDGMLLNYGKINFDIDNRTTGQISKILEDAAIKLVNISEKTYKPIIREKLDTSDSKTKLKYGNKKRNKKISQFAYNKIDEAIESRAKKKGVGIIPVNPAYTSVIGKMKYMRELGISIHEAAAYVIGRRGMGYKEKVPAIYKKLIPKAKLYKHHWSHWRYLHSQLSKIKIHDFYKVSLNDRIFLNIKGFKTLVS
jgi:IS605 OrfB family transposase